jgi:2-polyprenyl-6-methoxyphenol hydroxylase-like FAD-dependent oxidoreductase
MDETEEQDCVVVGAGPGGAVLAYLLVRAGARVTLLESRPTSPAGSAATPSRRR